MRRLVEDDIRCVVDTICDIRIDFVVASLLFLVEFIGMFFIGSYLCEIVREEREKFCVTQQNHELILAFGSEKDRKMRER